MAKLDSLIVDMEVNSAKLRQGLDEAKEHLKSFSERAKEMGESIHALSEMAAVEFGKKIVEHLAEFVMKGAEAADQMGKLAQSAGVPVETMSKLSYAAKLSGVGTEELGVAMGKLNKNLADAGAGVATNAALFEALGVKVKDASGKVRSSDEVLGDIADKFAGMEDGASKSALAMEVFGKSGAQLIPFLNQGRAGLSELSAEAERLGVVITDKAAKGAEEFNDNIEKLKLATQGVAQRAAGELAPALTKLTENLLKSKDGAAALKEASDVLATAIKVVVTAALALWNTLSLVGVAIAGIASAAVALATGGFKAAGESVKATMEEMKKTLMANGERIVNVWETTAGETKKVVEEENKVVKTNADAVQKAFEQKKQAAADYKEALKTVQKQVAEMNAKAEGVGGNAYDQKLADIASGELSKVVDKLGAHSHLYAEKLREAALHLEIATQRYAKEQSDFELNRKQAEVSRQGDVRSESFGNIGKEWSEVFRKLTAGFGSFDEALAEYTRATREREKQLADAALFKNMGQLGEGLKEEALLAADKLAVVAEQANRAAKAYEENATKVAAANKTYDEAMKVIGEDATKLAKEVEQQFSGRNFAESFAVITQGFKSMDEALASYEMNTRRAAETQAEADRLMSTGYTALAQDTKELANSFRDASKRAHDAADSFKSMADRTSSVIEGSVSHLASKLGEAGQIVQGAFAAYKQAGGGVLGWISAIISVIIDVASGFKAFGEMVKDFDSTIGKLRDDLKEGLGSLLDGIVALARDFRPIANVIHEIINPILKLIGDILKELAEALGPLIKAIADLLKPIAKLIGVILDVVGKILAPIFKLIGALLSPIASILERIGQLLSKVFDALEPLWDLISTLAEIISEIVDALGPIFETLGDVLGVIFDVLGWIIDLSNAITPLGPIMKIIANSLRFVGETILGSVNGVELVWEYILEAVRGLWASFGGDTSGIDKTIADNKANIQSIQDQMTKLWEGMQDPFAPDTNPTLQDGTGVVKPGIKAKAFDRATYQVGFLGNAAQKSGEKMAKLNEELTNVPQGFKVALRRFQAMAPREGGGGDTNHIRQGDTYNIAGSVRTTAQEKKEAYAASKKDKFRKKGI